MDITGKMQRTLDLAKEALNRGECPIAAMVFLGDQVIAQSHTREIAERRFLVHAELNALLEADRQRYSYEERKEMQLFTNLEPCMMCFGAAMSSYVGEVHFGLESPSDGAVQMARDWNPQSADFPGYRVPKVTGGILRAESQRLFREFEERCAPGPTRTWVHSLTRL